MSSTPNFLFLHDPGVKFRGRARADISKHSSIDREREQMHKLDSFVQKYDVIFEKLWYVGHIFVMTTSLLSILLCLTWQVEKALPNLIYRSTFLGVLFTYSISLLQNLNGATPGFYALLPLNTFQYIVLAVLWLVTTPHTIKLIPFALYSLLHVADAASQHHAESNSRRRISQGFSDHLAPTVIETIGYLDMWLLLQLFGDCLLMRPGAVVSLLTFGFFFQVKMMYSTACTDAFMNVFRFADSILASEKCPKRVWEFWHKMRLELDLDEFKNSEMYHKESERAIEEANLYLFPPDF